MATSKTLTPTNVTIQIPAFADKPDQRVNSNCIDKEADAINALSDQIANISKGTFRYMGVACAISANEIRLFIPLANFDTNATVTFTKFGVTNVWSDNEGVDKISTTSKISGGIYISAGATGAFVNKDAYFFDITFTVS